VADDIPLSWLFYALFALLAFSAFFAMSETCLMALNRYRLKHLIREGSHGAKLAGHLLDRTDELLSFILAGNTLMNAAITILVAEICRRLLGTEDYVLAVATLSAGFFILVFAEILPKVIGATYSEPIALAASYVLAPLIKITRWPMWVVNVFVKAILKVMRVRPMAEHAAPLSMAELRTLVLEGGKFIPKKHRSIFLNLFELEDMTVDDTMTPRSQIEYLDISDDLDDVRNKLGTDARATAYQRKRSRRVAAQSRNRNDGLIIPQAPDQSTGAQAALSFVNLARSYLRSVCAGPRPGANLRVGPMNTLLGFPDAPPRPHRGFSRD